jgi:8-oxo-dGTP diphosphatase
MIYETKPADFNPKFEVVSLFIEHKDKVLFLKNNETKKHNPLLWGIPAGKIETAENKEKALLREIKEETGILLKKEQLEYDSTVYIKYPTHDFIYHMYKTELQKQETIILSKEHLKYKWLAPKEALKLPLIRDEDACIKKVYKI